MGNGKGLGFHLIFVSIFLVVTTYSCLGVQDTNVVCSEKERIALLDFKHSVKDHLGMLSTWVGHDCCRWKRIHCDNVTGNVESINLRGDVRYSDIQNYKLVHDDEYVPGDASSSVRDGYFLLGSEVNPSLAQLRHLKYLDLSCNFFERSRIPEFIGSFKQLSYLNLSYASFQGIIPLHIGNLSNLKVLDLSSNDGLMVDDMSWTFGLSSLKYFNLSSVDLSGAQNWGMFFYMIPSLKEIGLSHCQLSNIDIGPFENSTKNVPNIKHLDLSFNSFKGPTPGFFQNMTSLVFLDLSDFDLNLSWSFESLLRMIPSLLELHLSRCGLHNMHLSPPHLNSSTLSSIEHLDLSENSVGGIYPSILTNMSSIRVLDLSQNMLNSWVPIMPNLLELDLSSNQFKHIEHVGIFRQCHLKHLSASENYFKIVMINSSKNVSECSQYDLERLNLHMSLSGTIPDPIGRMKNLRDLDLSNNGLTGLIPESVGRLIFLEVLDLSHNQLTGPIPTFLGNLTTLDLSFNYLNGSIPESLGTLATLTNLHLESNQLTGPIPTSIGELILLEAISLYSNMLDGTIPVSVGKLAKLRYLDIFNNSLEGVVFEAHLANLSMLKLLDTSSNTKLTFNVSREWIPSFELVSLDLSSCNIANGFPQWLRNQRKLEMLVLSNSKILGPLPTWLRKMPVIPFLDLSHNKLSGPLTNLPNRGNLDVLGIQFTRALLLENNLFSDSIPRSLCRRTDLEVLDLSINRLIGNIPKCLENLTSLETMVLSSNQLSGVIPSSIAINCVSLLRLKLSGNKLVGELPEELGNLQSLLVLDLGDNKFTGNIPAWIGENLISLVVLRLHKNNLTGRIPRSLCKASALHILDVAYNSLTGAIPNCLGQLDAMVHNSSLVPWYTSDIDSDDTVTQYMKGLDLEYGRHWYLVFNMDLSSNKLVGEIPVELTSLSMLLGLNLSNNHLNGGIPETIGNMKSLFSLDLSKNELTGKIPGSMAALNFLSHLNLSHNNLSGIIPTGNQLQTLSDPSIYAGNKDLCGPLLPNNRSNHEDPTTTPEKRYEVADKPTEVWFYVDIWSGFLTGFWGIIGVFLLKKQWRQNLFMFVEENMEKIHVSVMIRVAKMKRGREAT